MKKLLGHNKSNKLNFEERDVKFHVNDQEVVIKPGQVPSTLSLARFLRSHLNLTGTKVMCHQAGCGACVVTAYVPFEGADKGYRVNSVNSCITPVLSCDGWHVVTVEGLGSRKDDMHPIQERLAAFHGTQCGFCSPGMVMQMNSFMEKNPNATMKEIEHILDGNMCRCTGYRPIHDAFKSFASDATPELKKTLADIEDAGGCKGKGKSICPSTGRACGGSSGGRKCSKSGSHTVTHQGTEEGEWYMPENLEELLSVLEHLPEGTKYRLVAGNTGTGVYQDGPYDVYIDTKKVSVLSKHSKSPLEIGGGMVLGDIMDLMKTLAKENPSYSYGEAIAAHINVVANTAIRNTGTLAGNLMLKHAYQYFPSDLFIMLEALGANIVVASAADGGKESKFGMAEWLKTSMDRRVIVKICLPALSKSHVFRSFKITPRQVHAHAYVNAAFLFNVGDKASGYKVMEKPHICYGGITDGFVHASKTETFLNGKSLADGNTLKGALKTLKEEVNPHPETLEAEPLYRQNLTQSLLYKVFLGIVGDNVDASLRSGSTILQRDVSKGQQTYKTDESLWPLNQGIAKVEGKSQCTGEAQYIDDMPRYPGELSAAMVTGTRSNCELDVVDPAPALAMPGVRHFIDHTAVPGINSWVPWAEAEEIFSTGKIHYAGQCIGLILADTPELALKAAKAVKVSYKNLKPVVTNIRDAMKDENRVVNEFPDFFGFRPVHLKVGDVEEKKKEGDLTVVEGEFETGQQYHFYMETLSAVCRPKEDNQIDLFASTQWMDFTQNLVAGALGIKKNQIDMQVRRIGGGYGGKCTPAFFVAVATAVAAFKINKPVRMVLDIKSNMQSFGKRENYLAQYKAGVDKEGKLQFVDLTLNAACGWNCSESMTIAEAGPFSQSAYNSNSWSIRPVGIKTDYSRTTAVRAPGTTQGHAIMENVMEHLACKLKIDPNELRRKNFIQDGDMQVVGHPFHGENPLSKMMDELMDSSSYKERRAAVDSFNASNKWKKRGMSVVPVKYTIHAMPPMPFYAHISVYEGDGTIAVSHGGIEMGQGINTKVQQTVAQTLGVPMDMIIVKPADNVISPNNIVTGGSTTSEMTCMAAQKAAQALKDRMANVGANMEAPKWHELVQACFFQGIDLTARHMGHSGNDKISGYTIWGVVIHEVEIDILTGERNLVRTDLMEDTGAALNPEVDIGQIEGSYVFSLGWNLQEQIKYDPETGACVTADTWDYKPPTCFDIPEDLRTTLCETKRMEGTLGSKATGEPGMLFGCGASFAIRDAVKSARKDFGIAGDDKETDWVNLSLPVTVEKLQLATGITPEHYTL